MHSSVTCLQSLHLAVLAALSLHAACIKTLSPCQTEARPGLDNTHVDVVGSHCKRLGWPTNSNSSTAVVAATLDTTTVADVLSAAEHFMSDVQLLWFACSTDYQPAAVVMEFIRPDQAIPHCNLLG